MMMGLATLSQAGAAAVLFYLIAYLFMNLGAFAVVAFLRDEIGSEDLSHYPGLIQRAPVMTVLLSIFLLSLLGIPPLAGFAAKFQIFRVLYQSGQNYAAVDSPVYQNLGLTMYALLVIGGLNTAISAVYYLKVMKVMILDRPVAEPSTRMGELPTSADSVFFGTLLAALIFVVGIYWDPLALASARGVERFQDFHNRTPARAENSQ
jgi:NADH-quinone oxidoreductase subunit N